MPIQRLGIAQDLFYNKDCYHSLVTQVTCDCTRLIQDASIGLLRAMHDGRVWRLSSIKARIDAGDILNEPIQHYMGRPIPMVWVAVLCFSVFLLQVNRLQYIHIYHPILCRWLQVTMPTPTRGTPFQSLKSAMHPRHSWSCGHSRISIGFWHFCGLS